jgi:hypothetical protein
VSSGLAEGKYPGVSYLLTFFRRVFLPIRNIMVRDIMEHVSDSSTRGYSIDCDLFVSTVFGQDADNGVNRAFGAEVD